MRGAAAWPHPVWMPLGCRGPAERSGGRWQGAAWPCWRLCWRGAAGDPGGGSRREGATGGQKAYTENWKGPIIFSNRVAFDGPTRSRIGEWWGAGLCKGSMRVGCDPEEAVCCGGW